MRPGATSWIAHAGTSPTDCTTTWKSNPYILVSSLLFAASIGRIPYTCSILEGRRHLMETRIRNHKLHGSTRAQRIVQYMWYRTYQCAPPHVIRTEEGVVYVSETYALDILEISSQQLVELPQFEQEGATLLQNGRIY